MNVYDLAVLKREARAFALRGEMGFLSLVDVEHWAEIALTERGGPSDQLYDLVVARRLGLLKSQQRLVEFGGEPGPSDVAPALMTIDDDCPSADEAEVRCNILGDVWRRFCCDPLPGKLHALLVEAMDDGTAFSYPKLLQGKGLETHVAHIRSLFRRIGEHARRLSRETPEDGQRARGIA